jgi:hypothetical protein
MSIDYGERGRLTFESLVTAIGQLHYMLSAQATKAVNASLTLRNWLIGYYIEEYERRGTDRATYGRLPTIQVSAFGNSGNG